MIIFPFSSYWWFYLSFAALIVILLSIDLLSHRHPHPISFRESLTWTCVWVALALTFSGFFFLFARWEAGVPVARRLWLEFLTGYVVEQSLSVDNMFVFAVVFRYFQVESRFQRTVLFYGVLGAIVFRGLFIAAGAALMRFELVAIGFGVFLIVTGIRMARSAEKKFDPGSNVVIRSLQRFLPVTPYTDGEKFWIRSGGRLLFTPLLIVLLALETTDLLFAVDSVPAVFGVTREPLVVFTSNVFAILGLRSMYFLLAGAIDRFHGLKYGLAFVLAFVGVKMAVLDHLGAERFPAGISLAIIALALGTSVAASLRFSSLDRHVWIPRLVGFLCLVLSGVCLFSACGLIPHLPPEVGTLPLAISAGCYALIGWGILRFRPL